MSITSNSDGIHINGHIGTWHVIDEKVHKAQNVFLLEHDEYGDEAASLIVDKDGEILMDEVFNGFDDLDELEDE